MNDRLYIFVEGNDDELFFRTIIVPIFQKIYQTVEIIKFAQLKKIKVENFIFSINTLKFDYLLFADIDYFKSVNQKKIYIQERFPNIDLELIYIVIKEIESWYFAGISDDLSRKFGIKPMKNTNELVKEEFNLLYHRKFNSRIDFMIEILKNYSIDIAQKKNDSFAYFSDKKLKSILQN